jgi:hypothetical protein
MKKSYFDKFNDLSQEELNKELESACKKNDLDAIKYLLTSPELKIHADIHSGRNAVFRIACVYGHLDIVRYLLTDKNLKEKIDIHIDDDIGLALAASYGELKIVKYLLTSPELKEHANIQADDNKVLKAACIFGDVGLVKYLLSSPELKQHADVTVENNFCFIESLSLGHIDLAKYLLTFDEIRNHPNFDKHKEKVFQKALANIENSEEINGRMLAIKFLIFDLNIEKNQQIENYLSDLNFKQIEDWFSLRELNKSLENELPVSKHAANTRLKV